MKGGALATAIARGEQRASRTARGLDELTRLLHAFCWRWSQLSEAQVADSLPADRREDSSHDEDGRSVILPLPAAAPDRRAA